MIGAMAMGGSMGDLGSVIMDLVKKSEGFAKLLEAVNGVLQEVADALGIAFTVVTPVVQSFGQSLQPLLDAVRPLLLMLVRLSPAFLILSLAVRVLGPAVEILSRIVSNVVRIVSSSVIGLLMIVRMVMNKLGVDTDAIDEAIEGVRNATAPIDGLGDAAGGVCEAMINVPVGFKAATSQLAQQSGEPTPGSQRIFDRFFGGAAGNTSGSGADASSDASVTIVSNDPDEIWQQLSRLMERDGFRIAAS